MIATNLYEQFYELSVLQLSFFEILFLNCAFGIVAPFDVALVVFVTSARGNKIIETKTMKFKHVLFFFNRVNMHYFTCIHTCK